MTDVRVSGGPAPDLQTVTGTGLGPRRRYPTDAPAAGGPSRWGEAAPALVSLLASGGAPVCEGDSCFVPGAEGAWSEIPD